jgi:predicted phage tail protein
MKEVILNGFLGDKYFKKMSMKAHRIGDIFACIECNFPEFRKDMIEFAEAGGDISVMYGDKYVEDPEEFMYSIGPDTVVITPLPAGAKGGGAKLLLAGLIVASFFIPGSSALLIAGGGVTSVTTGATLSAGAALLGGAGVAAGASFSLSFAGLALAGLATSLALQGLQQIMAPDPSVDSGIGANDDYLFDGAKNTIAQNNVVPVLFGEMIVGGVLISTATVAGTVIPRTHGATWGLTSTSGGDRTGGSIGSSNTVFPTEDVYTTFSNARNFTG